MNFLLFFLFLQTDSRICNISEPIGSWLEKYEGPCHEIKGHFILNSTATNFKKKLFSAFSNLTKIEGCVKIENTQLKNLSFLSSLQEVICNENDAEAANLTNVIDVEGLNFTTLGFNSLQTVTGPGEVKIFRTTKFGSSVSRCFSKEEVVFLAYHKQFNGDMYLPCQEIHDPCFRLDLLGPQLKGGPTYTFENIPPNCTTFFGALSIIGAIGEDYLLGRFDNLTLIVGLLHIGCTLLESHPGVQYVHARINRFLTNWSIPTLLPIRPLDVGNVYEANQLYRLFPLFFSENNMVEHLERDTFLPELVEDPCAHFPQFNGSCGVVLTKSFIKGISVEQQYTTWCYKFDDLPMREECVPFEGFYYETWLMSMVALVIGIIYSSRAMILLAFSKANKSLPYFRLLLLLILFISLLTALESSLVYQKAMRVFGSRSYFLPQFDSIHLFHPLSLWMLAFLASSRHSCLAVIVYCYVDIILFSATKSRRLSLGLCLLVLVGFPILTAYLNSQINLVIRGVRPLYSKEPWQLFYIPFIMNNKFVPTFNTYMPESNMLVYNSDATLYSSSPFEDDGGYYDNVMNVLVTDFPLDTFGQLLPEFSKICDIGMVVAASLFFVFELATNFVNCQGLSMTLILLYLQLSISRIRYFLHDGILVTDYCSLQDFMNGVGIGGDNSMGESSLLKYISCFDAGQEMQLYVGGNFAGRWGDGWKYWYLPTQMTRYHWDVLFEMLSYFSYLLVSSFCYKFARFQSYLGAAIDHEAKMAKQTKTVKVTPKTPVS